MNKIYSFIKNRPWLWIIGGFAAFVAAWLALILIASSNKPEFIQP